MVSVLRGGKHHRAGLPLLGFRHTLCGNEDQVRTSNRSERTSCLHDIRGLLLGSASGKLARLLVGWIDPKATPQAACKLKVSLTHEEIGQMIGTSRETVTRLMGDFKRQHLIEQSGATLTIPSRVALEHLIPL